MKLSLQDVRQTLIKAFWPLRDVSLDRRPDGAADTIGGTCEILKRLVEPECNTDLLHQAIDYEVDEVLKVETQPIFVGSDLPMTLEDLAEIFIREDQLEYLISSEDYGEFRDRLRDILAGYKQVLVDPLIDKFADDWDPNDSSLANKNISNFITWIDDFIHKTSRRVPDNDDVILTIEERVLQRDYEKKYRYRVEDFAHVLSPNS